jgi:hypothetical protein
MRQQKKIVAYDAKNITYGQKGSRMEMSPEEALSKE